MAPPFIERVELNRMAGKMLPAIEYLRTVCRVRSQEGANYTHLATKLADMIDVRDRIISIAESLPEGPLEAFAREHPLHFDQLDNAAYCGYGYENGRPTKSCPTHDSALHWDAWELMGTSYKRPSSAMRGN